MLPAGIRRLFRLPAPRVAADVEAELQFHLDERVAALQAHGMRREDAREQALREFGDLPSTRAALERLDRAAHARSRRQQWGNDWWLDVRQAVRSLRRTPGVTVAVVVMLALGIGANAAMFDILDRLLLRPPEGIARADGLVRLYTRQASSFDNREFVHGGFDIDQYGALAAHVDGFERLAGYWPTRVNLGRGQAGGRADVTIVTGTYFDLLGVGAAYGRLLEPGDDREGAPPAAVIAHHYWLRRFGGDAGVLDSTIVLNGVRYAIVGVAARGFAGLEPALTDVWLPTHVAGPAARGSQWRQRRRGGQTHKLVVRVAPDMAVLGVEEKATAVLRTTLDQHDDPNTRVLTGPLPEARGPMATSRRVRLSLLVGGVAVIVLVVAAANSASLLLLRAAARRRELAIRTALGAGRWRVTRLLLLESLVLAAGSALAATGLVALASHVLRAALLPGYPMPASMLDTRVLSFTALLTVAIGLVTGLAPVVRARGASVGDLHLGVRAARRARSLARQGLIVLQVALSVALLFGASVFFRSLEHARRTDLNFDVQHLAAVNLENESRSDTAALSAAVIEAFARRLRGIPGVTGLARSTSPLTGSWTVTDLRVPGVDSLPRTGGFWITAVDSGFFDLVGARIVRGRGFLGRDDAAAAPVAVVNQHMARLLWPGRDPLGTCLYVGDPANVCRTIVGVVETIRDRGPADTLFMAGYYVPLTQPPFRVRAPAFLIRSADDPRRLTADLLQALRLYFPDLPADRVSVLPDVMSTRIRSWAVGTWLFSVAAGVALLIAAIGLFSVLAFIVRQREHEFGIRRAVGAGTRHLIALVLRQAFAVAVAGVGVGIAVCAWGARLLDPLVFPGRESRDPVALSVAALVLLLVALLAALIPALAAARVDPRQALQAE